MRDSGETGRRGESLATDYLRRAGFVIVERNWRCGHYEIDIIARKGWVLHFVEVKTRAAGGWTTPEQAVTAAKSRALMRAARAYAAMHRCHDDDIQFDLIAVDMSPDGSYEIRLVENAVEQGW